MAFTTVQPKRNKLLASAIALGLLATAQASLADIAEVTTEEGDVMSFEYEGDMLRVNTPDNEGYMLLRDNKMYVVSYNDGQAMVFDMSSAFKMFGQMATSATPGTVDSKVISLKPTGASETLGGMKGEVYELRYIDHEGKERQADMVLSDDPLAVGFRDAVENMARSVAKAMDNKQFQDEIEAGEKLQQQLAALNKGVLRYGKDMKVRSIKDTTVDAARFALPAEPTDLGGVMSGMFGGGSGGSSGGSLSDLFGGGSQQPSENDTSEEDAENTADSVGKAVGEAFGKLFGN